MTDHDVLVKELLKQQVPLRLEAEPDWDEVLRKAGLDGAAPARASLRTRLRRPRVLVPALIVLALLVVTGVAFAVDGIPWWESAPPPVTPGLVDALANEPPVVDPLTGEILPTPDGERARTVAQEDGAALVAVPLGETGYCLILTADGLSGGGRPCSYQADDDARVYARPESAWRARWIIYGRLIDPKAAALDLSKAAGFPFVVQLRRGGFFLANVPQEHWGDLNRQRGEAKVLDRSGATIRTGCVSWGPGPEDELVKTSFRGIGALGFWHELGSDCRALPFRPQVAGATKLVELTPRGELEPPPPETESTTIALWRAPQADGTVCVVHARAAPQLGPPPSITGEAGPNPATGWKCGASDSLQQTRNGKPIEVSVSAGQSNDDDAYWRIDGHVDPDSGIARLELRPASDMAAVAFANGWFLGQLPQTESMRDFPSGGPYVLVGYDSDGNEVARVDLEQVWRDEVREATGR